MKFIPQHDQMDCGPACMTMVTHYFKKPYPIHHIRDLCQITQLGVSFAGLCDAAKKIGINPFPAKINIKTLKENLVMPCILHWHHNHFVMLYKVSVNRLTGKLKFYIADPAHGKIMLDEEKFLKSWLFGKENEGFVIFLEKTEDFGKGHEELEHVDHRILLQYLYPFKKKVVVMALLMLLGSGLTLILPYLTEALIDKGIQKDNVNFVNLILLAQLAVFSGAIAIEIARNWIVLYLGAHMSIDIISDFLKKLLKLPISFFDTKKFGDFTQRIQDNKRIEEFLTSQSLTTLFSIITLTVFFVVLWTYKPIIAMTYLGITLISVAWSLYWLEIRRKLDYYKFQESAANQDSLHEIVTGVKEMKLNQFEEFQLKKWKKIQFNLFNINLKILKNSQVQVSGFEFFNQVKNILVTYIAARFVINGQISLGALLSVSFIIGQMNSPVNQLISFFRSFQYAMLSMTRLHEVQVREPEERQSYISMDEVIDDYSDEKSRGIEFCDLSFAFSKVKKPVLENISMFIPEGKVTAIVGKSGSGKTTIMKLLLRYYEPSSGKIFCNGKNLLDISPRSIRSNSGVVMQDGMMFTETIERNIAMGDEVIDRDRVVRAARTAEIHDYIESLPLKYKTIIGNSGKPLSMGQNQRLLIARAVYKNPDYLFFDEATSALDASTEKNIHQNLTKFFKGKTVVVIAHRLSTVRHADQIIVLDKGKITEVGSHECLIRNKSAYFDLVSNQLELHVA